jgi:hypothetical protein
MTYVANNQTPMISFSIAKKGYIVQVNGIEAMLFPREEGAGNDCVSDQFGMPQMIALMRTLCNPTAVSQDLSALPG